jgi:hypothetical protein
MISTLTPNEFIGYAFAIAAIACWALIVSFKP